MKDNRLVWVDLEMTGLDPERDVIIEIATIITDNDLSIIAQGPHHVIHQPDDILGTMIPEVELIHARSGLTNLVRSSHISLEQAACETREFIEEHCQRGNAPLCGNSIWKDREFIARYMPQITEYLHYRIVDVSSIKTLVQRWYPHNKKTSFKKPEVHRALDDVKASIEELKHYRNAFFICNP